MNILEKHYRSNVIWNAIQTLYYRFAYIIYFFILYSMVEKKTFGIIGTCFSLIYLTVTFFELGITQSFSLYFLSFCKNKKAFWLFIRAQCMVHSVLFFGLVPLFLFGHYLLSYRLSLPIIDVKLLALLFVIFMFESIKKVVKKILDLALFYQQTTAIEITGISVFLGMILLYYFSGNALTIQYVFIAMFANSFICVGLLLKYTVQWYHSLPNNSEFMPNQQLFWTLLNIRFFAHMATLGESVFSSNFLIPLIATYQGFEVIGLYKIVGTLAYNVSLFLEHTFGQTGETILAHLKDAPIAEKKQAFNQASKHVYHSMVVLFVFLLINYQKLLYSTSYSFDKSLLISIMCYFFILINRSFFVTYKPFYTIQGKFVFYSIIKLATFFLAYGIIHYASVNSLLVLPSLLVIQFFSLAAIAAGAYYLWKIRIPFSISPLHLISYTVFSLAFFFLF